MAKTSFPLTLLCLLGFAVPGEANLQPTAPTAPERGVQRIEGKAYWTNFEIPFQYTDPEIVLLDRGGLWAKRQNHYSAPPRGQIFGEINSNIDKSPFEFSLDLPTTPQGEFHDVDNNGKADPGVQIWGLFLANNAVLTANEPNLTPIEQLTQLSVPIASVVTTPPTSLTGIAEPRRGALIVYSNEPNQGFPAGFGEDGLLFTADDPIATLDPGYTVVRLKAEGFVFERSRRVEISLQERPEDAEIDLSYLDYTEAFNRLLDLLKRRYAYTELRGIDWEMWRQQYLPQVEAAQQAGNPNAYFTVLRSLKRRMRDAHVQVYASSDLQDTEDDRAIASVGIAPVELSDNRIIARQVLPDSPAAAAGILPFAEILAVNGVPIGDRVAQLMTQLSQVTAENRRLKAVSRSLFFPDDTPIRLQYRNPNQPPQTVTLTSDNFTYNSPYLFFGLPYQTLTSPGGQTYGYAQWTSFLGDRETFTELAAFIQTLNQRRIGGLILDLRRNSGGSVATLIQLISYFWTVENPLYLQETISQRRDIQTQEKLNFSTFEISPNFPIYAPEPNAYYGGKIVILIGTECISACEFFSDWMQRYQRATLIGSHRTKGAGGSVTIVPLPESITFTYTYTQELDLNQQPYIEARGVQPDILVPITEDFVRTQLSEKDPVLERALEYLAAISPES